MPKKFESFSCTKDCSNWKQLSARTDSLYQRDNDVRNEFARDYTRLLHSCAFRRLKHKTQVFFNIGNDHVCTRMEHVFHVESVSNTIASHLGLNTELTRAIAVGHDLGHAPFGHEGETVIKKIANKYLNDDTFWHERNGLYVVDNIELLEDHKKISRNLNLTYAVRDGIISHCGEVDENGLKPRKELIELYDIDAPGKVPPATWEGCVVKIADKIAYIGRDIEGATRLGFLSQKDKSDLTKMARANNQETINTTAIMHNMIIDICEHSSIDTGISLSETFFKQLNQIKKYNYDYIYKNKRLEPFKSYAHLIINQLFTVLYEQYKDNGETTVLHLKSMSKYYPKYVGSFLKWVSKYCDPAFVQDAFGEEYIKTLDSFENRKIYSCFDTKEIFARAILDNISGMTDRYAIEIFNELITL